MNYSCMLKRNILLSLFLLCFLMMFHHMFQYLSMSLFESNIAFAHYMFRSPKNALKVLDDAFRKVALNISRTHVLKADMVYRENLHVRLIALPNLPEVYRSNLPNCSDVGQFLCISGTVTRASTAKMLQYKKLWRCSKCKYQFIIEAEVDQDYVCVKPVICSNPVWCNGKSFTLMSTDINTEWCKDYQEIKLQEQVYNLNVGTVPRSMWVVLEDDLVESCYPGNDVIVSGILFQQWKPLQIGCETDIGLVILAHNIEVQNKMSSSVVSKEMAYEIGQFWQDHKSCPMKGRDFILSSICPQVFGLYIVKLAVALILAGGVQKKDGNSRIRGDSHILLIGDPGTAKSQFLKFASKVSPRSVMTSGIGTTNAGLTVSAIKESGRWQLEAGALVLADGGVCCIDEFSCIKEQDKTCIHEAMEQQTISVAKAGLVCSLNTRCSILAATNPKGRYDENMSISENTALGSPLLSRFDIILVLLDTNDETWDKMVSSYILGGRNILNGNKAALWPVAKMKSYFTLIRQINPKVTSGAERVLQTYYTKQRSLQAKNTSRTTPRLLQSLIRLAEGHARLMFRNEVLICDAVIAIALMESSMVGHSILEGMSPLLTVFPDDPAAEYENKAKIVLNNLNLNVSVKENCDAFYQKSRIGKMLFDISAAWLSKENPYIFDSTQNVNISNNSMFQESDICERTTNECTFNKPPSVTNKKVIPSDYSNSYEDVPLYQVTVEAEIHHDNQNIFGNNIFQVPASKGSKKLKTGSNVGNNESMFSNRTSMDDLSFLHQILEEPDIHNIDFNKLRDQPSTLSDIHTIFNQKRHPTSTLTCSNTTPEILSRNNYCSINEGFTSTQSQRNSTSILQELGISPDGNSKEIILQQQGRSQTENSIIDPVIEKTTSAINFPAKRSLADQLKRFAIARCQRASQQSNSQIHNTLHESNKNGQSSKYAINLSENVQEPSQITNCEEMDIHVEIDVADISKMNQHAHILRNEDLCLPKPAKILKESNNLGIKSPERIQSNHPASGTLFKSSEISQSDISDTDAGTIPVQPVLQNEKKANSNMFNKFIFRKKSSKT